ncbi:hypothetical protein IFR04_011910, partial [Cadophora malorum]
TLMDTTNAKLKGERRRRKRENEGINRRKDTLVKKAFELGEFDGVDELMCSLATNNTDTLLLFRRIQTPANKGYTTIPSETSDGRVTIVEPEWRH